MESAITVTVVPSYSDVIGSSERRLVPHERTRDTETAASKAMKKGLDALSTKKKGRRKPSGVVLEMPHVRAPRAAASAAPSPSPPLGVPSAAPIFGEVGTEPEGEEESAGSDDGDRGDRPPIEDTVGGNVIRPLLYFAGIGVLLCLWG